MSGDATDISNAIHRTNETIAPLARILTEIIKDHRQEIAVFLQTGGVLRDIVNSLESINSRLDQMNKHLSEIDIDIFRLNHND